MREDEDIVPASNPVPGQARTLTECEFEPTYLIVCARIKEAVRRRRAHDADDIEQECKTRLLVRWRAAGASLVVPDDLHAFAEKIVANYFVDLARSLATRREVFDDNPDHDVDAIEPENPQDPDTALGQRERLEQAYEWLELLPEKMRGVMRRHIDGLEYAEIASELGISESTVRSHVHNARQLLHEIVARYGEESR